VLKWPTHTHAHTRARAHTHTHTHTYRGTENSLDLDENFTDRMRLAKEALSEREVVHDFRKHVMAIFKLSLHDSDVSGKTGREGVKVAKGGRDG
jgi:GH25 family lysozyme M1 (1,4-beta-N-acetylmuramidase)